MFCEQGFHVQSNCWKKREEIFYCIADIGHLKDLIPIAVVKVWVTENNIDIGLVLRKPWYLNIRVCCTVVLFQFTKHV